MLAAAFASLLPSALSHAQGEGEDSGLHALHLSQRAIPDDLAGKSIYFLLVDRFARPEGAPHEPCEGKKWCNGTLTGLIEKLPYIHGMGFDCVWITPVVKQSEARCFGERCLDPYHGYWPEDWYSIDPHFGSADDLKLLSRMLREQGTCLMMDTVLHHVRPVSSSEDLANVRPFNRTEDFWMWNASDGDTLTNTRSIRCRRLCHTVTLVVVRRRTSQSMAGSWTSPRSRLAAVSVFARSLTTGSSS